MASNTNGTANGRAGKLSSKYDPDAQIILFQGDALEYMRTVPSGTVKLVVSSPPYNLGKSYETRVSVEKYLDTQRAILAELHRILRNDGSICWQVGNYVDDGEVYPLDMYYYPIFKELGMQLRNRIIWGFGHGLHASRRFSGRYETLLWFTKSKDYTFNLDPVRIPSKYPGKLHYKGPNIGKPSGNPLGKNPSDIWDIMLDEWECGFWDIPNVKSNHPEKTSHPCQFPIELAERCVLAMTNEGDWVYDPFSGVGSTILAAIRRNRRGMGSEQEPEYVEITRHRLTEHFAGSLRARKLGTPVHVPSGREKVSQVPREWQRDDTQTSLFDSESGDR